MSDSASRKLYRASTFSFLLLITALFATPVSAQLRITGVVDGPLSGGIPKAVEIYASANVADLSTCGIGSANNGGGSDGEEFTFPAVAASAGDFITVASEAPGFTSFFGFAPDYTSGAANINGNDAIELFCGGVVVDIFGDINVDGTGQPWEHLDGWAYRNNGTGPDGSTFALGSWSFSGPNALDGETTNAGAATPFPIGSFSAVGGDISPTVSSTIPGNGASGVALDASISINFSENVTASGSWFDITCGSSGGHTATVSGGPQSYSLDPDSDFVNSENCVVTIFAVQVVDQDGSADNMTGNYVFDFDTAALVVPSDIIINEIDYNQAGTDRAEFVEILNTGANPADLTGHSLVLINGTGGGAAPYQTFNLPAISLPAGGYFVVCGDAANVYNCDMDVSPDSNLIQNGAPDGVALFAGATLLDTVSYEGSLPAPYTETDGSGLSDSSSALFLGISRSPDGTDTDVNNADFSRRCITPGFANTLDDTGCVDPTPPPLRINEIDYDQPGSDAAEFVEIINAGNSPADLDGVSLVLVNGSNDTPYLTLPLPAVMLGAGDYFVICKTFASVANCDLEGFSSIQNGSPDAVALSRAGLVIDAVSYEGDVAAPYVEGSGSGLTDSGSSGQDNRGISRFPNGVDTNQNNVDLTNACITPGIANTDSTSACSPTGPLAEIFEIQGSGATSPFDGQGVATVDNVVTVVGPEGFFMQTPTARDDADIDTSNGIYVFTGGAPGVAVGDLVDVSGGVNEFFDFTEFTAGSTVTVTGAGSVPAAVAFDDTVPSPDRLAPSCAIEFECYEGMRIEIVGGTVTGPNQSFGSDPIAEVRVTAATTRTFREPGIEFPGLFGFPEWDGNPEMFELDPDKLGLPNEVIAGGSHFDAVGVLGFEFGGYEIWPSELTIYPAVLPAAVRSRNVNEMTVGALNLFRLYDDVDDAPIPRYDPETDTTYPPDTDDTVIGTSEYTTRLTKFSMYIRNVLGAPDILAVSEVESLAVLQDLADLINADDGSLVYTPYLEEGNDIGGIDVGFLVLDTVAVDNVTQLGRFEILAYDNSLLNDRPPLLLEGRQVSDGSDFPIAVIAIHSRSLSGIDGNSGERVRQKRYEQAQFVAQVVQDLQTNDPDINLVVAGDFNAFEFTDGYADATGFMKGGFVALDNLVCDTNPCPDLVNPNLMNQVLVIPAGERYSFNFGGNAQTLDHALTSSGLDELVRDFGYGRGNSDVFEDVIEDDSTPLRSSDHDGLVLFLEKDSDGDGVMDNVDVCMGTVIPESAGMVSLGVNRWALHDDDREFDNGGAEGIGEELSYDIFDTQGCSCEQIVEMQHLGKGHLMHGCSIGAMKNWLEALE